MICLHNLHREIGCLTIKHRRTNDNIILALKVMKNDIVSDHVKYLFPIIFQPKTNCTNFVIKMTFPSINKDHCSIWKSTPELITSCSKKSSISWAVLKACYFTKKIPILKVLPYIHPFLSDKHARSQIKCNDLKGDLVHDHISDHTRCSYCLIPETTEQQ